MEKIIVNQKEINEQLLEDMFVTAIEGGSNYWAKFHSLPKEIREKYKDEPYSIKFAKAIFEGHNVIVSDIEADEDDDDEKWTINIESVKKGLEIMAKDHSEQFENMLEENYDAETGDVFFQLCVLGEITFG
jgi:hypothetical protein